jgi:hypothetical protein
LLSKTCTFTETHAFFVIMLSVVTIISIDRQRCVDDVIALIYVILRLRDCLSPNPSRSRTVSLQLSISAPIGALRHTL